MSSAAAKYFRNAAASVVLLGVAASSLAALVEIKFETNAIAIPTPLNATETAFQAAVNALGVTPGGITGRLYYESTTSGTTNVAGNTRTFNSAVESLSFNVAGWFSQSLTGIGNGGDIVVRNNAGTASNTDSITTTVRCAPAIGAGSTCPLGTQNFNYSFTDAAGVVWSLDLFTLLLQETSAGVEPLSGLGLPTAAEWESPLWTVQRIDLRFNPYDASGRLTANVTERGTISFLAVPEPGVLGLVGLGMIGLALSGRRQFAQQFRTERSAA